MLDVFRVVVPNCNEIIRVILGWFDDNYCCTLEGQQPLHICRREIVVHNLVESVGQVGLKSGSLEDIADLCLPMALVLNGSSMSSGGGVWPDFGTSKTMLGRWSVFPV